MSCRHIWRQLNLHPHKQQCFHKTSNPKPSSIFHPPIIMLFKIFPSIFPICGDKNIVQYLYCDVCHTRPLPTPGLFTIFSFFHQKNTTRISCGVVVPAPENYIVLNRYCTSDINLWLFLYKKIKYNFF